MQFKLVLNHLFLIFFGLVFSQEISVMTYNIKYANENDGVNSWSYRKDDLAKQINYYAPDILGMQEVVLEQRDFLLNQNNNYKSVGKGRDDGKNAGEFSPIFYKNSKFKALKSGTFWLSDSPESPGKAWDAAYPRVCSWVQLQSIENSLQIFWVFNTHFDHVGIEARKNSLQLIQHKITELNSKNQPFIIMGDFNLDAKSVEIKTFISNMKKSYFSFQDTFSTHHYGIDGTFNGYQSLPEMPRIDYIFSFGLNILNHRTIEDKRTNGLWFSDHLPVLVKFNFN